MCFTENLSWFAFSLGLVGFAGAFQHGGPTRSLAVGALPVIVIQLWEGLMHRGIRPGAIPRTQPNIERLAMISTYIQPLAILAAVAYAMPRRKKLDGNGGSGGMPKWLIIAVVVYTALSTGRAFLLWNKLKPNVARTDCPPSSSSTARCRLRWGWWDSEGKRLHGFMYFFTLLLFSPP